MPKQSRFLEELRWVHAAGAYDMPGQVHVGLDPHSTTRYAPAHAANWCALVTRYDHRFLYIAASVYIA